MSGSDLCIPRNETAVVFFPKQNYNGLSPNFHIRVSVSVGLGTEFRSEKIPRNRLGTVSVIPRKKVLIPRHSEFRGRANSEGRNGREFREKK